MLLTYDINFSDEFKNIAVQFKPLNAIDSNGLTNLLMIVKF